MKILLQPTTTRSALRSTVALCMTLFCGASAHAFVLGDMDAEQATKTSTAFVESGRTYLHQGVFGVGEQSNNVTLSSAQKRSGGFSYRFFSPSRAGSGVWRQHIWVSQSRIGFEEDQWMGFSFRLEGFGTVRGFHQLQQFIMFGEGPTSELQIKKGTNNQLLIAAFRGTNHDNKIQVVNKTVNIAQNAWFDVIINFKPSTGGSGKYDLWLKQGSAGSYTKQVTYRGAIGYSAHRFVTNPRLPDVRRNEHGAMIGTYRALDNPQQVLYIDNVRLNSSFANVNPSR